MTDHFRHPHHYRTDSKILRNYYRRRIRKLLIYICLVLFVFCLFELASCVCLPLWNAESTYKKEYERFKIASEMAASYIPDAFETINHVEYKKYPIVVFGENKRSAIINDICNETAVIQNASADLFMLSDQAKVGIMDENEENAVISEDEIKPGISEDAAVGSEDEPEETTGHLDEESLPEPKDYDEETIIAVLDSIEEITGYETATEGNDPNGRLNTEDGYKAAVFFTTSLFDPEEVEGKTILDKGTEAGGSIELYETDALALDRVRYLASFDETVYANANHIAFGTLVIRVSNRIDEESRNTLSKKLVECFR